jgi:hypothetical protein
MGRREAAGRYMTYHLKSFQTLKLFSVMYFLKIIDHNSNMYYNKTYKLKIKTGG